jgi:hypothetical protein
MGIEPTEPTLNVSPNGFEDRGRHQAGSHLQAGFCMVGILHPVESSHRLQASLVISNQTANDVPPVASANFNVPL